MYMTELNKLNKLARIAEQIKKFLTKGRKCQYPSIYVRNIIDNAKIFILLALYKSIFCLKLLIFQEVCIKISTNYLSRYFKQF